MARKQDSVPTKRANDPRAKSAPKKSAPKKVEPKNPAQLDPSYEFLAKDRLNFNGIANLPKEDFTMKRKEILNGYSKTDLNVLLTTYTGGLTKANLERTAKKDIVEMVVHAELKKVANQTLKKDGKIKYPVSTGTGRKSADPEAKKKWIEEIGAFLRGNFKEEQIRERITKGLISRYSVKVGKVRMVVEPITEGGKWSRIKVHYKGTSENLDLTKKAVNDFITRQSEDK